MAIQIDENNKGYLKVDSTPTENGILAAWRCLQTEVTAWDDFLDSIPNMHFYQTSVWGQVRMLDGWQPFVVVITLDGQIIGGFQVLSRLKKYFGKIGLLLKGPICISDDTNTGRFVIQALKNFTARHAIKALIVQPPDLDNNVAMLLEKSDFSRDHVKYMLSNTVRVNLLRDKETILASMKHNKRKNIKTAIHKGVCVREGNESDIDTFFHFMIETCRRQAVTPSPSNKEFLTSLWNLFSPNRIKLFISECEGSPLSGIMVLLCSDIAYLWKFGWSGKSGHCRPNDILYWETFLYAKEKGLHVADMSAIDDEILSKIVKKEHISEELSKNYSYFKIGFGGEVVQLNSGFVYFPNALIRLVYNMFMPHINSVPFLRRKILLK